jgi:hypothetical protein
MASKIAGYLELSEIPTPSVSPVAGVQQLYPKSDGNLYGKNNVGQEYRLSNDGDNILILATTPVVPLYNHGSVYLTGALVQTITLPTPSLFPNRSISFVNRSSFDKTFSSSYITTSGTTDTILRPGESITLKTDGTSWYSNSQSNTRTLFVPLAANMVSTSNIRANIPGFTFPTVAGKFYRIQAIGTFTSSINTTGISIGSIVTGTSTIKGTCNIGLSNATVTTDVSGTISNISTINTLVNSFVTSTSVNLANTQIQFNYDTVLSTTIGGVFNLQFASEVNFSTTTLQAGTTFIVTQLN